MAPAIGDLAPFPAAALSNRSGADFDESGAASKDDDDDADVSG